jgi:hypothetical protein
MRRGGRSREVLATSLLVGGFALLHVGGVGCAYKSSGAVAPIVYVLSPYVGVDQSAPVRTAVPIPPTVRVTNLSGIPVSGVAVVYRSLSPGAILVDSATVSTVNGTAAIGSWTLGPNAGIYVLEARVQSTGLPDVTTLFRASANATP